MLLSKGKRRESERSRNNKTIDLACSRDAKNTFCITLCIPTQISQDIIIECERDVENGIGIGIARATR